MTETIRAGDLRHALLPGNYRLFSSHHSLKLAEADVNTGCNHRPLGALISVICKLVGVPRKLAVRFYHL